jgi:hypothetical protein
MLIMILLIGYYGKLMAIFLIPIGFSFCHAFVTLVFILSGRPHPSLALPVYDGEGTGGVRRGEQG